MAFCFYPTSILPFDSHILPLDSHNNYRATYICSSNEAQKNMT